MIEDALKFLSGQARKAARLKVVNLPDRRFAIADAGGAVTFGEPAPPPLQARAGTLETAVAHSTAGEVWVSRYGVTVVQDPPHRRERVTLHLDVSPQLQTVTDWAKSPTGAKFTQAELILLLRTRFAQCVADGRLFGSLKLLKWRRQDDADSSVKVGAVSLGRSIRQTVEGDSPIPETFVLRVPVFSSPAFATTGDVTIALEPDPATEKLAVIPLAGEVERVTYEAEMKLFEAVQTAVAAAGTAAQVYSGSVA